MTLRAVVQLGRAPRRRDARRRCVLPPSARAFVMLLDRCGFVNGAVYAAALVAVLAAADSAVVSRRAGPCDPDMTGAADE